MEDRFNMFSESLSPEGKLLILCARTQVSAVETRQIRSLVQDGIDWDSLVDLAYEHQVAPLMRRSGPPAIAALARRTAAAPSRGRCSTGAWL